MKKLSESSKEGYFGLYPLKKETRFWQNLTDLRCLLRHQALQGELESTPVDHQIMRPMKEQELKDNDTNIKYVKNGQNPQMAYTQVHYLKGKVFQMLFRYFLVKRYVCSTTAHCRSL